jgi:hypothetical protein
VAGAALLAAGLTTVLLPLIEGREHGWPLWTRVSLGAAPLILGGFCVASGAWASKAATFCSTSACSRSAASRPASRPSCSWPARRRLSSFLALYLQMGRGLGALEAGLVFTILAVAYVITSAPAPGLTDRFGRSLVAGCGVALTLGLVALALAIAETGTTGTPVALVPGLLLVGAGIGLCFTPLTSTVLKNVDPARAGSASGAMSTMQQVGYSLGVAITGIVYFGASDGGVSHAFRAQPDPAGCGGRGHRRGVEAAAGSFGRKFGHKAHNKSTNRRYGGLRTWSALISTSRRIWTGTRSCTPAST